MQLRLVLVAAQAATVLLTWNTWQVRSRPPNLPLLPLPEFNLPAFDMGWPLLASLVAVIAAPRIGVPLHAAALLLAIAVLPLVHRTAHWWESNRSKFIVSMA